MSIDLDDLYPFKRDLVEEFFIKTADDNYVNARWCAQYGLDVDFFWLALHCSEKYMKAALLLNGRSAKRYQHDIKALYADVQTLAPELLPGTLETPAGLAEHLLFSLGSEPTEKFVERVYFYGQPDNRYQLIGYVKRETDLLKLDQLVFALRRLCQPLESHFISQRDKGIEGVPDETVRQRMVKDDPVPRDLHSSLDETIAGGRGKYLRRIALNWNFPFAPSDYNHGRLRTGHRLANPVTVRRFLEPLDAGTDAQDKHADELWEWAKDNVQLPGAFVKLYEAERKARKQKARAPKS